MWKKLVQNANSYVGDTTSFIMFQDDCKHRYATTEKTFRNFVAIEQIPCCPII